MTRLSSLCGALTLLVLFAACGSDSPAAPSGSGGVTGSGGAGGSGSQSSAYRATIDGQQWFATSATLGAEWSRGLFTVTGTSTSNLTFAFTVAASEPGTLSSFGFGAPSNALYTAPNGEWTVDSINGGTGTVTFNRLSATSAAGTFSFTLVPLPGSGATGMKEVVGGAFDVALPCPPC